MSRLLRWVPTVAAALGAASYGLAGNWSAMVAAIGASLWALATVFTSASARSWRAAAGSWRRVVEMREARHEQPHLVDGGCHCKRSCCIAWWPPQGARAWRSVCICPECNEDCPGIGRLGAYESVMADRAILRSAEDT